jgi:hypothetical protein
MRNEDDNIILDCYRLAKQYGIDPDVFLNKPLSVIRKHIVWTSKLLEKQRQQSADDEL